MKNLNTAAISYGEGWKAMTWLMRWWVPEVLPPTSGQWWEEWALYGSAIS